MVVNAEFLDGTGTDTTGRDGRGSGNRTRVTTEAQSVAGQQWRGGHFPTLFSQFGLTLPENLHPLRLICNLHFPEFSYPTFILPFLPSPCRLFPQVFTFVSNFFSTVLFSLFDAVVVVVTVVALFTQ